MANAAPPLSVAEVLRMVQKVWQYRVEGRLVLPGLQCAIITGAVIDDLINEPDAFLLLGHLKRHHQNLRDEFILANALSEFILANALSETFNWPLRRYKRAKSILIDHGHIEIVHPGGDGPGDPPRAKFTSSIRGADMLTNTNNTPPPLS